VGAFIGYTTKKVLRIVGIALKFVLQVLTAAFLVGFVSALVLVGYIIGGMGSGASTQFASSLEQQTLNQGSAIYAWLSQTAYPWIVQVATVYGGEAWTWLSATVQSAGPFFGAFGLSTLTMFAIAFKKA
jgi:hypothetical protein